MFKLFKFLFRVDTSRIYSDSAAPPVSNASSNCLHLFHGTFASELDATDYCLTPLGRNQPEPLTRDLPDAVIDTSEVEIIFGTARINGAIPMLTQQPDDFRDQIGSDNTIILIAEAAFGGLPYMLNDTPNLKYAGTFYAT